MQLKARIDLKPLHNIRVLSNEALLAVDSYKRRHEENINLLQDESRSTTLK